MEVPTNDEMGDLTPDDLEFEELAIAEDELIDAYVHNELSSDERNLLENGLKISPRLAERVHFARMLANAAAQSNSGVVKPPWWKTILGLVERPALKMAFGTCVIIILVGGVALLAGWMKLRSQTRRVAAEKTALEQRRQELEKINTDQQSRSNQLTAELQTERAKSELNQKKIEQLKKSISELERSTSPATPSTVASIFLLSGLTRSGGGVNELTVSRTTITIRIQFALETDEYPTYRATIENSQGNRISKTGLRSRNSRAGKVVLFEISANRIPPGDYTALVSGVTSSGVVDDIYDYEFRVRRTMD